jgi:hypothetical protein
MVVVRGGKPNMGFLNFLRKFVTDRNKSVWFRLDHEEVARNHRNCANEYWAKQAA